MEKLFYLITIIGIVVSLFYAHKYYKEETEKKIILTKSLENAHYDTIKYESAEAVQRSVDVDEYYKKLKIKEENMRSTEFANYQASQMVENAMQIEMASVNNASIQYAITASTNYYNSQEKWLKTNYGKFQNILIKYKENLIGFYCAEKYNDINYQIPNLATKNKKDAAITYYVFKGFSVSSLGAKPTLPVLSGTTSSSISFPVILPEYFTIFTIIRSNDSRLLHIQEDENYFIGKGTYRIEDDNPVETNQWLIVGFRNETPLKNKISKSFMVNKDERGKLGKINFENYKLSINVFPYPYLYNSYKISFDFSTLIIFNRLLTDEEMDITHNALNEYLTQNNILFSDLVL
jgi:hypothetical protein